MPEHSSVTLTWWLSGLPAVNLATECDYSHINTCGQCTHYMALRLAWRPCWALKCYSAFTQHVMFNSKAAKKIFDLKAASASRVWEDRSPSFHLSSFVSCDVELISDFPHSPAVIISLSSSLCSFILPQPTLSLCFLLGICCYLSLFTRLSPRLLFSLSVLFLFLHFTNVTFKH